MLCSQARNMLLYYNTASLHKEASCWIGLIDLPEKPDKKLGCWSVVTIIVAWVQGHTLLESTTNTRCNKSPDRETLFLPILIPLLGQVSTSKLHSFFSSFGCQMLYNTEDIKQVQNHQKAPKISFDKSKFTDNGTSTETDVCDCMSFFEWLGCVACGVDW